MQRLFSAGKIGIFLDDFAPGTEKRHGEDTKIITLALRVQPFDAKLATAIDEGIGGDSAVRSLLFSLTTGDPKAHLERVRISLGCPPQNLAVYAAPDIAEPRMALLQCKIGTAYARTQKDVNGFTFVFKATFGQATRDELEFLQHWYLGQQFVTFTEAEPVLETESAPAA